jgi:hypothetical protein
MIPHHHFLYLKASYIAQCIEEIKQELRIDNISVKCNAVAKLTYVCFQNYFLKLFASNS